MVSKATVEGLQVSSSPTKEELIFLYQEYERKAVFADQTDLVISLLKSKRRLKITQIHNLYFDHPTNGKTKKFILQWLLVAPWFANVLMTKKEVIFDLYGCCFWGTTHDHDKDETLLRIYTDIAKFDLTQSA